MVGFGIDFGTTNSVVAQYDKAQNLITAFTQPGSNLPHPSVVWYRANGDVIAGAQAKKQIATLDGIEGNRFYTGIKRKLGQSFANEHFGKEIRTYKIAAEIFKMLKQDASVHHSTDLQEATVTIPIGFDGIKRKAIRQAADLAGIKICNFIHEPFAAIMGYLHRPDTQLTLQDIEDEVILVFDWGGGTLDITLVQVKNQHIQEIATGNLPDRAGEDFDKYIQNHIKFKESVEKDLDIEQMDLRNNLDRFKSECEIKKIQLSQQESVKIELSQAYRYGDKRHSIAQELSRESFNKLIAKDVEQAIIQVDKTLEKAAIAPENVGRVLLIGGSSRIPYIQDELRARFGYKVIEVSNADTIIAEGAAVIDALKLQPTFARGIGIELADGNVYPVFEAGTSANTNICQKTLNFYCVDHRDGEAKALIKEFGEGEHDEHLLKVLNIDVHKAEGLHKRFHEQVRVDFELDENMVLHVRGKGAARNKVKYVEVHKLCFGLKG